MTWVHPYDQYKDLPVSLGQITYSGPNPHHPYIDWNSKQLQCQIGALWYKQKMNTKVLHKASKIAGTGWHEQRP
jgi:hypothetical protein